MQGAGGTSGGSGQFFLGLMMMCGGFYLLLNSIMVTSSFGLGMRLFGIGGGYGVTTGMVMLPMVIGVGMVFYNARNYLGWLLALGSVTALIAGVIASVQFTLRTMNAFELITILVLAIGGLGLFLRSLKEAR
jgi:drug/metabolite transporter (DMT)-like permease